MIFPSSTISIEDETVPPRFGMEPLPMAAFFLAARAEHARMWRRITQLRPFFSQSFVAAFERDGCPVNHSHDYVALGRLSHRRFLARIPVYLRAIRECTPFVANSEICYAFSLDLLFLLFLIKLATRSKARLVYEVADIHPSLSAPTLRGRVMRFVERMLIRRCCAVVLTSPAFRSGYFAEVQRFFDFPSVVIEHKVALPAAVRDRASFRPVRDSVLVIGYPGLMKSPASFDLLVGLAEAGRGRIKIHFHGKFVLPLSEEECLQTIQSSPHLAYFGPYRSPEDLEQIYTSIDMVWDAYAEGENARWQRTTRFSESCFFKRPMIYNPTTEDGKLAGRYDLGLPISFDDPDDVIERVLAIDEETLRGWFHNLSQLPRNLVFYENEYEDLVRLIADSAPTLSNA